MRTIYFVGAMAFVATLGYIYAPRFIDSRYAPIAIASEKPADGPKAPAAADTSPKSPAPMAAPTPPAASPARARPAAPPAPRAGAKHAQAKGAKGKGKKKKPHKAGEARRQLTGQSDEPAANLDGSIDQQALADATGLTPAASEARPARVARRPTPARGQENQLHDRWIPGLSGGGARLSMGKSRNAGGCAEEYSHCERKEAPKDLVLAGVVDKVSPAEPLQGRIAEGSYVDDTPAVYVK
jgi:hypothetical protein